MSNSRLSSEFLSKCPRTAVTVWSTIDLTVFASASWLLMACFTCSSLVSSRRAISRRSAALRETPSWIGPSAVSRVC